MSPTGLLHFVFSVLTIVLGAIVLLLPKGTRWHRTWGHGYVWCMLGVIATSFAMFNLTGAVTPFHGAAAVATVTIAGGMWTVLRRRPKKHWIGAHATWMAWSYVGICAALVAETSTRFVMPALADRFEASALWGWFWGIVILASVAVFVVGAWLIKRRLPRSVAQAPESMRRERKELSEV